MAKKSKGLVEDSLSGGSHGLQDSPEIAAEEPIKGEDPAQSKRRLASANKSRGSTRQASKPAPDSSKDEQADERVTRKKWPKDKDKKLAAMAKVMPEFIVEYFGNVVAISAAMYSPPSLVEKAISSDPDLIEMQEVAVNSKEALLVDRMTYLALNTKSSAPGKFLLEKEYAERWGKTTAASGTKHKGFTAPKDEPSEMKSVLGLTQESDGSPSDTN
jgi:hypothetical protein